MAERTLGPVQTKLRRVLLEAGGFLSYRELSDRMSGRAESALRSISGRANRLHGPVFRVERTGIRLVGEKE